MQQQPPPDPALDQAYRAAEYCVTEAGACSILRIGQPSGWLDQLLPDGAGAAFVTGWNPLGRHRGLAENRAANERLAGEARRLGARVLRGVGRAPDHSWEEESLLLVGIAPEDAMRLALDHRQLAWVWVPAAPRVPVLRWTGLSPDQCGAPTPG